MRGRRRGGEACRGAIYRGRARMDFFADDFIADDISSEDITSDDAAAIYRAPTTGTLHIEASLAPLSHGAASPASDAAPISRGAAADAATIIADVDIEALRLPETIAMLSRYCTLKSGDLILPASAAITFPALLNHQLTAACTAPSCTASATTAAPCLITRLK